MAASAMASATTSAAPRDRVLDDAKAAADEQSKTRMCGPQECGH